MPACGASFLLILAAVAYGQADHPLSNFKELRMNSQTIKSFDGNNFKQLLTSQSGKASDTCSNISTTDIVFVLDESGSIGDNNFRIAKQFIANLTQYFDIGSGDSQSRVGFVLFQDSAEVIFDLQNYTSNGAVYNAIMNAVYGGGGTNIASGMQAAIDLVFKRSYRPDVNKLMIVLTDGQDTSDVVTQHQRAAALNITTYAIGIGSVSQKSINFSASYEPAKLANAALHSRGYRITEILGINDSGGHFQDVSVHVSSCLLSHDRFYSTTNLLERELLVVYRVYEEIRRGVNLIVPDIDLVELVQITGNKNNVFNVTNFNGLLGFLSTFCHAISHNSGRTCPCTISKIWLDIVIGIDVSTGVNGQINGIKTMLAQIIGALTVAQSGTQVSRVALYTFAGNDGNPSVNVIAYLGTFNSTDDAVNALFNIQSTSIVDVPLLKALTTAAGIFKRSDNRPNARDVLILLSSKGADCTASGSAPADLCRTASDMNENGVEIISVQLDLGAGQYFDGLGNPCYRLQNDGHQAHNIINAFCQINCFCTKGYEQYIPYDNTCQKMGECVQGVEDGAAWNFAKIGCQRQNAFLADELSTQKHAFLQVLAIKISGGGAKMIPYWIGLNDKSPSGVYSWDRGTDPSMPLLSGDYTIWPSSAPNDQNGQKQCIAVDQYNHGFNLAWINQPCNSFDFTPAYFCQKNTCDTDNYCATP